MVFNDYPSFFFFTLDGSDEWLKLSLAKAVDMIKDDFY